MEIEVKLPKTINDFRIHHLKAFTDESFNVDDLTLNAKVKFLANVSLVSVPKLMRVDAVEINKMFNHCIALFSGYKLTGKPKDFLTVNGIEYERIDIRKVGIGFHIDVEGSDFKNDPVRLACINYIPKGTNYGDLDINDNMLHPIANRYEDFKLHFKMVDFLELNGFFLLKFVNLIDSYTESQKIKKTLKKLKIFGRGKN